ncbi:IclR family transcriptional regulator [Asticcacaulis excentricus]|uniref:Transcriptional regulator, IclR family n=1 Tax=Asticcacaulis excentricus (strain ATCC 15261 / DSM 4724 / KCTC 12464 / NCIMB 9791 / VKM B-1370 / CB 48) TaxID=573065 RepID=E8RU78_ASTEC|nr:IclR family transcriptional regulator [Asticcacaulis excentricus]ADU15049.1 transcriptional regulator, IclR family [Asticcacaulis excentricus CB 48]
MSEPTYSAPALEKGIEIIEFLAGQSDPLSIGEICAGVGRSKAEIYRMILTLEGKGYLRRDIAGRYTMTSRLFDFGMLYPPRQSLIETALPHMRALARDSEQSCHMTVLSREHIVAIARAESESMTAFGVKVGFRAPAATATSGRMIFGFLPLRDQLNWYHSMRGRIERPVLRAFLDEAREAKDQGYLVRDSSYTLGIVDLAVPIFAARANHAVAALIVPFMTHVVCHMGKPQVLDRLRQTAQAISSELY